MLALSGTSFAADPVLPVPILPVSPVAAAHDWSGFYAGVNAGYGWGGEAYSGGAVVLPFNDLNGLFGGVQLGANFQHDAVVFGVEGDIQLGGPTQTAIGTAAVDYFGMVRARVGVDVGNGILPYLTAGLAYGQGRLDPPLETQFHVGWTAGGGVEVELAEQISLKGEYLYTDLGERNYVGAAMPVGFRFHTVRAGVNFHF